MPQQHPQQKDLVTRSKFITAPPVSDDDTEEIIIPRPTRGRQQMKLDAQREGMEIYNALPPELQYMIDEFIDGNTRYRYKQTVVKELNAIARHKDYYRMFPYQEGPYYKRFFSYNAIRYRYGRFGEDDWKETKTDLFEFFDRTRVRHPWSSSWVLTEEGYRYEGEFHHDSSIEQVAYMREFTVDITMPIAKTLPGAWRFFGIKVDGVRPWYNPEYRNRTTTVTFTTEVTTHLTRVCWDPHMRDHRDDPLPASLWMCYDGQYTEAVLLAAFLSPAVRGSLEWERKRNYRVKELECNFILTKAMIKQLDLEQSEKILAKSRG